MIQFLLFIFLVMSAWGISAEDYTVCFINSLIFVILFVYEFYRDTEDNLKNQLKGKKDKIKDLEKDIFNLKAYAEELSNQLEKMFEENRELKKEKKVA